MITTIAQEKAPGSAPTLHGGNFDNLETKHGQLISVTADKQRIIKAIASETDDRAFIYGFCCGFVREAPEVSG